MRPSIGLFSLLVFLLAGSSVPARDGVGVRQVSIAAPERDRPLSVTIWYPAEDGGEPVAVGENRIFEGTPALKDAAIRKQRFPLVLLSHGSGSRVEGMAWIATKLAEAGFVVAGPNHPGTTSGDSTPAATPRIWERTGDLSAITTALTVDPDLASSIDPHRIGVLGFSLGGSTAMELAGARADLDAFVRYCDSYPAMMDCRWFRGGRGFVDGEPVKVDVLDLRSIDRVRFEQSNRDPRITSAVLVDPGLATAFTPDSLKAVDIPLTFINLGSAGTIPVAVRSDALAAQLPNATYEQVDEADHFSFLPVCKPAATDFLKSLGDPDPICAENPRRSRADIHLELIERVKMAFERTLKTR
ncbi:putative dienelactone hydrolase [Ciceribacter lividus]|uniref:Putative dienelactone hydrolase n=1 Tax=Ciceribacter lividus TaxID=1197950 RepID=A0A6I7HLW6_9HYPH|nr:alpha/beta fold hydrolase [Ciceribacter lividus]RCW23259.1 putative dienelactone hydrolase [Ciceribacter lividus]